MILPPGKTEAEVLETIDKVVSVLARTYVFGYHDIEDIKQDGRLFALRLLNSGKYDPSRPLANFLYIHVRNRLINLVRDKVHRHDPPCKKCHSGNPCMPDGGFCKRYARWSKLNQTKSNLIRPGEFVEGTCEARQSDDVEVRELIHRIREHLPLELQSLYLKMRDGVSVPKHQRTQVEEAVRTILKEVIHEH